MLTNPLEEYFLDDVVARVLGSFRSKEIKERRELYTIEVFDKMYFYGSLISFDGIYYVGDGTSGTYGRLDSGNGRVLHYLAENPRKAVGAGEIRRITENKWLLYDVPNRMLKLMERVNPYLENYIIAKIKSPAPTYMLGLKQNL